MTLVLLSLSLLALLMTPGPTNTLILVAGSEGGWRHVLRLVPVELSAYLVVVLSIALLAEDATGAVAAARPVVAIGAAIWVLYLAIRLWRTEDAIAGIGAVTAGRVAVTTALNPKGLIMGMVLMPMTGITPASITVLIACIGAVALCWAGIGVALPRIGRGAAGMGFLRRAASVWLMGLSVLLVFGGLGSA